MTGPGAPVALLLLAAAVLVPAPAARPRLRRLLAGPGTGRTDPAPVVRPGWLAAGAAAVGALVWAGTGSAPTAVAVSLLAGGGGAVAVRLGIRGPARAPDTELATAWELLAVCLEVGLPVAAALSVAADPLPGADGTQLRRVAGLLELGADPSDAWRGAEPLPALGAFARSAARSAGTGAALARTARSEAVRLRESLVHAAEARAQRAAVLITGPLGLCFLPAFLTLGIAPVVIGLADRALAQW